MEENRERRRQAVGDLLMRQRRGRGPAALCGGGGAGLGGAMAVPGGRGRREEMRNLQKTPRQFLLLLFSSFSVSVNPCFQALK